MTALSFTVIPNEVTAWQEVAAAPAVAHLDISPTAGGRVIIEAKPDGGNAVAVVSARELGSFGAYRGLFSIPAIPVGWSLRVAAVGGVTGTVTIE